MKAMDGRSRMDEVGNTKMDGQTDPKDKCVTMLTNTEENVRDGQTGI